MFWLRLKAFAKQHPTVLWALWMPILAFDALVFGSLSWNYLLINVVVNLVIAAVVVAEVFDLSDRYNKLVGKGGDSGDKFVITKDLKFSALGMNRILIDTRTVDTIPIDHTPQIVLYDEGEAKVYVLMVTATEDVKDKYTLEEEGVGIREIRMPTGEILEVHTLFPDGSLVGYDEGDDEEIDVQEDFLRKTIQENIDRVKRENPALVNPQPRETVEDLLAHELNQAPHPPNVLVDPSKPQAIPVAPPLPAKKDDYLNTIWERGFGVGYQEGLQDGVAEGLEAGEEIAEKEAESAADREEK